MKYIANTVVTLPSGTGLGLTKAQAATRAHLLKPEDRKGFYTNTAPVQFKVGEVFQYDGELPKALADMLDEAGNRRTATPAPAPEQTDPPGPPEEPEA